MLCFNQTDMISFTVVSQSKLLKKIIIFVRCPQCILVKYTCAIFPISLDKICTLILYSYSVLVLVDYSGKTYFFNFNFLASA